MSNALDLDPARTINDIVAAHPETIEVFNRFGFDVCCGGGARLEDAARRDGIDVETVLAALREALGT